MRIKQEVKVAKTPLTSLCLYLKLVEGIVTILNSNSLASYKFVNLSYS